MRDVSFEDYLLSKRIRLLYYLYERIYSFVKYNNQTNLNLVMYEPDDDNGLAEIDGTQNLNIKTKIHLHSIVYRQLKPADVILGKNSQQLLIEEAWL